MKLHPIISIHDIFVLRKFVAAVLLGLHLTPGRRLSATISEWLRQPKYQNIKCDGVMAILSDLLKPNPWSFSLQDLVEKIGCFSDDDKELFLNSEIIMMHILDRLAWSLETKVRDMCHRQEYVAVQRSWKKGCSHKAETFAYSATIPMVYPDGLGAIELDQLQERMDSRFSETSKTKSCVTCGVESLHYSKGSIVGNEQDFLIIRMSRPADFVSRKMEISMGRCTYTCKTVIHWDIEEKRGGVSTERRDGWYWHGVDMGQVEEEKYRECDLDSFLHFNKVAILIFVRTGSIEDIACNRAEDETDFPDLSSSFTKMDLSAAGSQCEEEQGVERSRTRSPSPEMQSGARKKGGGTSPTASTPVKDPKQKKTRLDTTFISPIKGTCTNRNIFGGSQSHREAPATQPMDTGSQSSQARLPSKLSNGKCVCICGAEGHLANHLRVAPRCVEELRQLDEFQFIKGEEEKETFIAKVTLLLLGCPAPNCPGGDHKGKALPTQCLEWYRGDGGRAMKFRGSFATASGADIKKKLSQFIRNSKRERNKVNTQQDQTTMSIISQQEEGGETLSAEQPLCFNGCVLEGTMAQHLRHNVQCCNAIVQKNMPDRSRAYQGKVELAVFDLSILLFFCANPACDHVTKKCRHNFKALCEHIRDSCINFYQNEGTWILEWEENLDPGEIYEKLLNRRRHLMKSQRNTEEHRMETYKAEYQTMLNNHCRTCFISGPIPGIQNHDLKLVGKCYATNTEQYGCPACLQGEKRHFELVGHMQEMIERLGKAKPNESMAMVALQVENAETNEKRVVFVPSHMLSLGDADTLDDNDSIPYTATVVVPNRPEALDAIEEAFFDKAYDEKDALREMIEFASVRPIVGTFSSELSVFWRMKQADIKAARKEIYSAMCGKGKGEIEGRGPNRAFISKTHPNWAKTKYLGIVETCTWSEGARAKRCKESSARSAVNGILKTWVCLTLVNIAASDVAQPTIAIAPAVLTSVYAKLRALVKHVIGPSYSNYDLELKFHATEWKIYLFGCLYSKEYDETNAKIAREFETTTAHEKVKLMAETVNSQKAVKPTVTLDYARLAADYGLEEERAKEIVKLALKHQSDGKVEPLSLIGLATLEVKDLHPDETRLRTRAAELGQSYGEDVTTYAAIEGIVNTIMKEGFSHIAAAYKDLELLKLQLANCGHQHCSDNIIKYHALIQRTGEHDGYGWTYERGPGESCVEPYIPNLLEANDQKISAHVVFQREEIETQHFEDDEILKDFPPSAFGNWKEVSVLEFLNGCIPGSKVPLLKGPTSQSIVSIISERNDTHTWTKIQGDVGEDGDRIEDLDWGEDVFFSQRNHPYIRSTSDVRVLYELRPDSMRDMSLAQFAVQYYVLWPSQETHHTNYYQQTVAAIDPVTKVGPDSSHLIAGSPIFSAAPVSMKLRNEKVMVKRKRDEDAVPQLLYSGALTKYANNVLFNPFTQRESIDATREEFETDNEKETRLQLFPMGVFTKLEEEEEEEDGD